MADITPTITQAPGVKSGRATGAYIVTWADMANGDKGLPVGVAGYKEKSVQVLGTFGAGGNAKIEGSNVDASVTDAEYSVLHDHALNALDVTAAGIKQIQETPAMMRPRISAGDVTSALTVRVVLKG